MPINYKLYASNWKTELRPAVLARAAHKCECCEVENYAVVRWLDGAYQLYEELRGNEWVEMVPGTYAEARELWRDLMSGSAFDDWKVIVLTVAHLDHDIQHNDLSNLKALCQRCHLKHDRADNARRRRYGKNHVHEQICIF